MTERRSDAPGTTPWDRWNGVRVGGIVGGILGVVTVLFISSRPFWIVLALAAVGATAGYWSERRKQH